jgi:hypothetical protein
MICREISRLFKIKNVLARKANGSKAFRGVGIKKDIDAN